MSTIYSTGAAMGFFFWRKQPQTTEQTQQSDPQKVQEAIDLVDKLVDMRDELLDEFGQPWVMIGAGSRREQDDAEKVHYRTTDELWAAQRRARGIVQKSPHARNAIENRISYVVGEGHVYTAAIKKGAGASDQLVADVQARLDGFVERNDWANRQAETQRRLDRDGECFRRKFVGENGELTIRFVEPSQVYTPTDKATDATVRMGIRTDPDDVETVLSYFVDEEEIEASEIQHIKANVDRNVRRGAPIFTAHICDTLNRITKIRRNMARGSDFQTSYAGIERLPKASAATGATLAQAAEVLRAQNPLTAKSESYLQSKAGKFIRTNAESTFEFPFSNTRYSQYVEVIADSLREVAAQFCMPEFMLTSDASNANFSSTLVAEGPAVKMFQRLQAVHRDADLELISAELDAAPEIPDNWRELIEIQVGFPTVVTRDEDKEVDRDKKMVDSGVMSPQTFAARHNLDYEQEQSQIDEHNAKYPERRLPKPAPSFGGGDGEPNEPGNREPGGKAKLAALKGELESAQSIEEARAILEHMLKAA